MKNISEKNLKILVGIVAALLLILNPSYFIFRLIPALTIWYVAILKLFNKEEKCRQYRWIVAGVIAQGFMSGWGVWRVTGNPLKGLMAYLLVDLIRVISFYIMSTEQYSVLGYVSGIIPTFIILHWAWRRLPDEIKVYGWT